MITTQCIMGTRKEALIQAIQQRPFVALNCELIPLTNEDGATLVIDKNRALNSLPSAATIPDFDVCVIGSDRFTVRDGIAIMTTRGNSPDPTKHGAMLSLIDWLYINGEHLLAQAPANEDEKVKALALIQAAQNVRRAKSRDSIQDVSVQVDAFALASTNICAGDQEILRQAVDQSVEERELNKESFWNSRDNVISRWSTKDTSFLFQNPRDKEFAKCVVSYRSTAPSYSDDENSGSEIVIRFTPDMLDKLSLRDFAHTTLGWTDALVRSDWIGSARSIEMTSTQYALVVEEVRRIMRNLGYSTK